MAYSDVKAKIINTLMGRPVGTEIQPENHQDYALSLLDYVRSLELTSQSGLIDIANEDTVPVQPSNARVAYITGIGQNSTITFTNFLDSLGNPIVVTSRPMEGGFIILLWNTQYWSYELIVSNISIISGQSIFYNYKIRKTFESYEAMYYNIVDPTGDDGNLITVGEIVSVKNLLDDSKDGVYSRTSTGWQFQTSFYSQIMKEGEKKSSLDAGYFGEKSLTDDYLYVCVQAGTAGNAKWKRMLMFESL